MRKADSAYVYAILESHEGIASYSTLDHKPEDPHRDLELQIPQDWAAEIDAVLSSLGEMVYELDSRD